MNVDEARVIISEGATLEVITAPVDVRHLDEMAAGWAEVCQAVTYQFAHNMVITWDSPYKLRASQVRGAWEQQAKSGVIHYAESACAWARVCRCSHETCFHGQMRDAEELVTEIVSPKTGAVTERRTTAVSWCPVCWEARNVIRADNGKDPRAVGDITP